MASVRKPALEIQENEKSVILEHGIEEKGEREEGML